MSSSPAPVIARSGRALAVSGAVSPRVSSAVSIRGVVMTSPPMESAGGRGLATESFRAGSRAIESTAGLGLLGAGGSPAAESTQVFMLVSCAFTTLSSLARSIATIAAFAESEVGVRGGINVVNWAPANFGTATISAS